MTDEEREQIATEIIEKLDRTLKEYIDGIGSDKITPSQFSAALIYTGKKVFNKDYKFILRDTDRQKVYDNYPYNYKLIKYIADYYIYITKTYSNVVSINGLSYLLNIDYQIIQMWADRTSEEASPEASAILQKIRNEQEQTLQEAGLYSGKNPVGYIAALNHFFRWNDAPGASAPQNDAKSIENLPDFSQFRQIVQSENGNN